MLSFKRAHFVDPLVTQSPNAPEFLFTLELNFLLFARETKKSILQSWRSRSREFKSAA